MWAASVLAAHTSIESHDLLDLVEALGTVGDQEHRPIFRRRQQFVDPFSSEEVVAFAPAPAMKTLSFAGIFCRWKLNSQASTVVA